MIPAIEVRRDNCRAAAARGFSTATDLADYLVNKGLPFRDAHHVVGSTVAFAQQKRSEEHTSELQSLMRNSYAFFCLKTKKTTHSTNSDTTQSKPLQTPTASSTL